MYISTKNSTYVHIDRCIEEGEKGRDMRIHYFTIHKLTYIIRLHIVFPLSTIHNDYVIVLGFTMYYYSVKVTLFLFFCFSLSPHVHHCRIEMFSVSIGIIQKVSLVIEKKNTFILDVVIHWEAFFFLIVFVLLLFSVQWKSQNQSFQLLHRRSFCHRFCSI